MHEFGKMGCQLATLGRSTQAPATVKNPPKCTCGEHFRAILTVTEARDHRDRPDPQFSVPFDGVFVRRQEKDNDAHLCHARLSVLQSSPNADQGTASLRKPLAPGGTET